MPRAVMQNLPLRYPFLTLSVVSQHADRRGKSLAIALRTGTRLRSFSNNEIDSLA